MLKFAGTVGGSALAIRSLGTSGKSFIARGFSNQILNPYGNAEREQLKSLKGQDLLRIDNYSPSELKAILALSHHLKMLHKNNKLSRPLVGSSIATIFQKRSTRTRVSTETGMNLLGGHSIFLSSEDIQLGVNETIQDTAIVLSRYNSIILARVFSHESVVELAKHSQVPVINALSDRHHPLQILADFMTIQEQFGPNLSGLQICWVGDGNNVLNDILLGGPLLGVNCAVATPKSYEPISSILQEAKQAATKYNTNLLVTNDPLDAVRDADVVFTDTWVSMGQESSAAKKKKDFAGYQVTKAMMEHGRAKPNWKFMHCLPRHQEEVDDEVFYSNRSLVFDEAENRMYTTMAVISVMLGHIDYN